MRTRLAPSPTGFLHVGNARTFLLTWLHARAAGGQVVLRVDDLDGPRVRSDAANAAVEDLRWLGLDWDEDLGVLVQSERGAVYEAALARLLAEGRAYPCVCTRSEVESAASAPHGPEGPRYPGTCRGRFTSRAEAERATGRPAAIRFVVSPGPVAFDDLAYGPQAFDPSAETGDFVIGKAAGTAAYQLATVVDDAASGVDTVIRGADLLPSTARQVLLQRALGLPTPAHLHVPLVVGADGRRLAKRHGDTTIASLRAKGWSAPALVGRIATTAGLCRPDEALSPRDLVPRYDPARLQTDPVVFEPGVFASPAQGPDAVGR
jgi:glutamyl-tRNA synthetase